MSEKSPLEQLEQEPTLDEVLRRDPRDIQEEDYLALMRHQRSERAARVTKGEAS